MKRIYLAGPIANCTDAEARDWREAAKDMLLDHGALGVDPMRRDYREADIEHTYREIVDLDKRDIATCDAVLVHWSRISTGTAMEILFAWSRGIPVIVACVGPQEILSPWIRYHSTVLLPTLAGALAWIKKHILE